LAAFAFAFLGAIRWPRILFASIVVTSAITGPSFHVLGGFGVDVALVIGHNAMYNTSEARALGRHDESRPHPRRAPKIESDEVGGEADG